MADKSAQQPSRWHGRYSTRGSIWTPEGRCIDFEMDLTKDQGETLLEVLWAQFKEPGDEPGTETDPLVQIPATLEEALAYLDKTRVTPSGELITFKRSVRGCSQADQEKEFLALTHHGIGEWVRNTWGLREGSPLRDHLMSLGLTHPDDMSSLLLTCLIRKEFGRPLDIEGQVKWYQDYWAKQRAGVDNG